MSTRRTIFSHNSKITQMELTEFEAAVLNMRNAQKSYFNTRNSKHLENSKFWERKVDEALELKKGERLF